MNPVHNRERHLTVWRPQNADPDVILTGITIHPAASAFSLSSLCPLCILWEAIKVGA